MRQDAISGYGPLIMGEIIDEKTHPRYKNS